MKLYHIFIFAAVAGAQWKPFEKKKWLGIDAISVGGPPWSAEETYRWDALADGEATSHTPKKTSPHTPDEKPSKDSKKNSKLTERALGFDFEPMVFQPPPEDGEYVWKQGGVDAWKRDAQAATDEQDVPGLVKPSESSPGYKLDARAADPKDPPGLLKPSDSSPGYKFTPRSAETSGLLKPSDSSPGYTINPRAVDDPPGLLKSSDSSPGYKISPRSTDSEDHSGLLKTSDSSPGYKLTPRSLNPRPPTGWFKPSDYSPGKPPGFVKPPDDSPIHQLKSGSILPKGPPGWTNPSHFTPGLKLNMKPTDSPLVHKLESRSAENPGLLKPSVDSPGYKINPRSDEAEDRGGVLEPSDDSPGYKVSTRSADPEGPAGLLKPSDSSPGYRINPRSHHAQTYPGLLFPSDDPPGYRFSPRSVDLKDSPMPRKPSVIPPGYKFDAHGLQKVRRPNNTQQKRYTGLSYGEPDLPGQWDVATRGIQVDEPSAPEDSPSGSEPAGRIQIDPPFESRSLLKIGRLNTTRQEASTGRSSVKPDLARLRDVADRVIQFVEPSVPKNNTILSSAKSLVKNLSKRAKAIGEPRKWKTKPWWKPDEYAEDWFTMDMEVCRNSVPLTAIEGCTVFRSLEWLLYGMIHTSTLITATHQELAHTAPQEQRGPITISIRSIFFVTEMLREIKSQLEATKILNNGDQLALVPCYLDYAYQMSSFLIALGEKAEGFARENPMRCVVYDKLEVLYILYRDVADLIHGEDPAIRTILDDTFPANFPETWFNKYEEAKPGGKIRDYVHRNDWPVIGKDSIWRRVQDSWRCIDDRKQAKAHYNTKWGAWAREGQMDRIAWFKKHEKDAEAAKQKILDETKHMKDGIHEGHLGGM